MLRKKFIFNFSSALQICFALFSNFKTDQDTRTSVMIVFDILKKKLLTFSKTAVEIYYEDFIGLQKKICQTFC